MICQKQESLIDINRAISDQLLAVAYNHPLKLKAES